jgi:hypothetical protein
MRAVDAWARRHRVIAAFVPAAMYFFVFWHGAGHILGATIAAVVMFFVTYGSSVIYIPHGSARNGVRELVSSLSGKPKSQSDGAAR